MLNTECPINNATRTNHALVYRYVVFNAMPNTDIVFTGNYDAQHHFDRSRENLTYGGEQCSVAADYYRGLYSNLNSQSMMLCQRMINFQVHTHKQIYHIFY